MPQRRTNLLKQMAAPSTLVIFIANSQLAHCADLRNFSETTGNLQKKGLMTSNMLDKKPLPYLDIVEKDPDYALAGVRVFVERRLTNVAKSVNENKPVPTGINNLLSYLQMKKTINSEQANALFKLNTWLNEAAHGGLVAQENEAIKTWIIEESPKLMQGLEELAVRVLAKRL